MTNPVKALVMSSYGSNSPMSPILWDASVKRSAVDQVGSCTPFPNILKPPIKPSHNLENKIPSSRYCRFQLVCVKVQIHSSLEPSLQYSQDLVPLKAASTTFLLVCFVCLKESACETRKNVFYLTSKALFILEIIKCHDVIKCVSMKHKTHIIE